MLGTKSSVLECLTWKIGRTHTRNCSHEQCKDIPETSIVSHASPGTQMLFFSFDVIVLCLQCMGLSTFSRMLKCSLLCELQTLTYTSGIGSICICLWKDMTFMVRTLSLFLTSMSPTEFHIDWSFFCKCNKLQHLHLSPESLNLVGCIIM